MINLTYKDKRINYKGESISLKGKKPLLYTTPASNSSLNVYNPDDLSSGIIKSSLDTNYRNVFTISENNIFIFKPGLVGISGIYKLNINTLEEISGPFELADFRAPRAVEYYDGHIYIGGGSDDPQSSDTPIRKYNINNPSVVVDEDDINYLITKLFVYNDFLYIGGWFDRIYRYDINDFESSEFITIGYENSDIAMDINNDLIYFGSNGNNIIEIRNVNNWSVVVDTIDTGSFNVRYLKVFDNFLYIAMDNKVEKYNVNDFSEPVDSTNDDGAVYSFDILDDFLYTGPAFGSGTIKKYNINDLSTIIDESPQLGSNHSDNKILIR